MKIISLLTFFWLSTNVFSSIPLFPEVEGYKLAIEDQKYDPGNLWDMINGAAELFLSYNFIELNISEYLKDDISYRVEMNNQLDMANAYGMYSSERASDFDFISIGVEGYTQSGGLNFLQGKYYIKMSVYHESDESLENLKTLAQGIIDNSFECTDIPETLKLFPEEGKIPRHDYYYAENYLGHTFLNKVYSADYKKNNSEFQLFISKDEKANEVLNRYFEFAKQNVKAEDGYYLIKDPYNSNIYISKKNNNLFAIINCEDLGTIKEYRSLLSTNLK